MSSPQYPCNHQNCPRQYSNKYNLQRHIECNHKKTKRFRCKNCGKYLSSKQNLQEHMHTHSQVTPYCCPEPRCGKFFRQSSQLSNHKRLHKEMKKFYSQQNQFVALKVDLSRFEEMFYETSRSRFENAEKSYLETLGQENKILLPSLSGPQFCENLPSLLRNL